MTKKKDRRIELSVVLSTGGFGVQGMDPNGDSAWWEFGPENDLTYGDAIIAMAMMAKDNPDQYVIQDNY